MKCELNIIAAMGANGGIGLHGRLPDWHLPGDLQRFKHITQGKVVVMGRTTFESLPVLLRDRITVVLTRHQEQEVCLVADEPDYQRYLVRPRADDMFGFQFSIPRPPWLLRASGMLRVSELLAHNYIRDSLRRIICDADRLWNFPFVIGGAEVFSQAMPAAALMFLTVAHRDVEADVFFPKIPRDTWHVIASDVLDPTRAEPATNYILIHESMRYTSLGNGYWRLAETVLPPSLFEARA